MIDIQRKMTDLMDRIDYINRIVTNSGQFKDPHVVAGNFVKICFQDHSNRQAIITALGGNDLTSSSLRTELSEFWRGYDEVMEFSKANMQRTATLLPAKINEQIEAKVKALGTHSSGQNGRG